MLVIVAAALISIIRVSGNYIYGNSVSFTTTGSGAITGNLIKDNSQKEALQYLMNMNNAIHIQDEYAQSSVLMIDSILNNKINDAIRNTTIAYVTNILHSDSRINNYSNNSVYVLVDRNKDVHYVGRTNDPRRREKEHLSIFSPLRHLRMEVVITGLDKDTARATEQILIHTYTLEALDNARNEISHFNIIRFGQEFGRSLNIMSSGNNLSTTIEDIFDWFRFR